MIEINTLGWITLCILIMIFSFTFGYLFNLIKLYKRIRKPSLGKLLTIPFKQMEKEIENPGDLV